jgi:Helix-turn-helix domain
MSIFRISNTKVVISNSSSPEKQAELQRIKTIFDGSSAGAQCERLLTALVRYRLTTFEAMRYLDVYHCPARVFQLRKQGYKITTYWETVVTESGDKHIVGCYALDSIDVQPVPLSEIPKTQKPSQLSLQFETVAEMVEALA